MEKEKEIKAAPTELGEEGIGKLLKSCDHFFIKVKTNVFSSRLLLYHAGKKILFYIKLYDFILFDGFHGFFLHNRSSNNLHLFDFGCFNRLCYRCRNHFLNRNRISCYRTRARSLFFYLFSLLIGITAFLIRVSHYNTFLSLNSFTTSIKASQAGDSGAVKFMGKYMVSVFMTSTRAGMVF